MMRAVVVISVAMLFIMMRGILWIRQDETPSVQASYPAANQETPPTSTATATPTVTPTSTPTITPTLRLNSGELDIDDDLPDFTISQVKLSQDIQRFITCADTSQWYVVVEVQGNVHAATDVTVIVEKTTIMSTLRQQRTPHYYEFWFPIEQIPKHRAFKVEIDPYDAIEEASEDNNIFQATLADLMPYLQIVRDCPATRTPTPTNTPGPSPTPTDGPSPTPTAT